MSSDIDSSINQDNLDIDSVIANVKQEFKNFLIKREQLVIKLGKALENEHQNKKENICAEIKGILRQEVANGLISRRDIERYSLDEWKKNTKPKKEENDNLSFSTQVKEATPRVLVDAYGNSEIESAATSNADPNNIVINESWPTDVENLNTDASPIDEDLEEEIKKSTSFVTADQQLSEQGTVVELKTEIERLRSNLQSKSDESSVLHTRIKELEARPQNDQADRYFDVQFQLPFEDLRAHMSSSFSKNNAVSKVSFSARVDVVNRKLTDIQIGEHLDSINDDSDTY